MFLAFVFPSERQPDRGRGLKLFVTTSHELVLGLLFFMIRIKFSRVSARDRTCYSFATGKVGKKNVFRRSPMYLPE